MSGPGNISPNSVVSDQLLRVTENHPLHASHFLLTLDATELAARAKPGQFIMIRFPGIRDPLLPRPMSICNVLPERDSRPGQIQILHKVVGRGTALLAALSPGEQIQVLGPLGQPFKIPTAPRKDSEALMVAGGIGIAIFPFLVGALEKSGWRPVLLFGARGKEDLVHRQWFEERGVEVRVATEDGSEGQKGRVTALLKNALIPEGSVGMTYACGPQPMLRAVGELVTRTSIPAQLSLECYMGCGIGACLGCVVKVRRGEGFEYKRICVDGPTLEARELLWD